MIITKNKVSVANYCNSNNHKWNEFTPEIKQNEQKEITKLEYHDEMCFTDYDRFVDHVTVKDKANNPILKLTLKPNECEELFDIAKIATISGQIPSSRKDDFFYVLYTVTLREFAASLFIHQPDNTQTYTHKIREYIQTNSNADYADIPINYYDINKKYFIRLNECSPKDSELGMGPFTNIKQMFESLVCSCRARKALQKAYWNGETEDERKISVNDYQQIGDNENEEEKVNKKDGFENFGNGTFLFCVPWRDDIKSRNEFRCFIKDNELKAVTQYVWYRDYGWIERKEILFGMCVDIQLLARKVTEYIGHDRYVLDVHLLMNDGDKGYEIEMIECNSFGAQMASGAGCFHWIRDYDQLYQLRECRNQIEVRVVVSDEYDKVYKERIKTKQRQILSGSVALDLIDELLTVFE